MSSQRTVRLAFLTAVALIAAAIGDPSVEVAANTGVFGNGYADHNHLGIVPTLIAGVTLVVGLLVLRAIDVWRLRCAEQGTQRSLGSWSAISRLPVTELGRVVPLQLAAVYGMESLEALMVGRPQPTGLVWLGAPLVFSLATHLAIGAACLWAMRRAVRWLAAGLDALVHVAAEFVLHLGAMTPPVHAFGFSRAAGRARHVSPPHVRRVRGRAPPPFLRRPTS